MLTFFSFWQLLILPGTLRFALRAGPDTGNPQFIMCVLTSAAAELPPHFQSSFSLFPPPPSCTLWTGIFTTAFLPYETFNLEAVNVWETAAIAGGLHGFRGFLDLCKIWNVWNIFFFEIMGCRRERTCNLLVFSLILWSSRMQDCQIRDSPSVEIKIVGRVYLMASVSRSRSATIKEKWM